MIETDYEVAILGGGLAGLTLAKQLLQDRPEMRIAVLERRTFPVEEAACKVGESTVEIGAHYLGEVVKLKKHLIEDQYPKFGLRFFFKDLGMTLEEATEVGGSDFFPAPSYQLDRGRLENFLVDTVADMKATVLPGSRVTGLHLAEENGPGPHRVTFSQDGHEKTLTARWVVDASGRQGLVKRHLDLSEDISHEINAVWFRIAADIRIDNWSDDTAWKERSGKIERRWLSTNHLLGPGYWVWVIPLASGMTSFGIVCDPRCHPLGDMNTLEKAMDWLYEYEPECAASIEPHLETGVKDFKALKRLAKNSRQVFSENRWALTGEAGVFLDPFYSPGSDYIAMGNTMICKMIQDDLDGEPLEHLAPTLQSVYLTLFQNNLLTYQDQYPLFGNARIMSLKIIWDYVLYWGFPALLYFQDQLTNAGFIQSIAKSIEQMRAMNLEMQQFFRDWHRHDDDSLIDPVFVDQQTVEILVRLNGELREPLDSVALKSRFERNVEIVRDLMSEMKSRIGQHYPQLADTELKNPTEPRLESVFETLNL